MVLSVWLGDNFHVHCAMVKIVFLCVQFMATFHIIILDRWCNKRNIMVRRLISNDKETISIDVKKKT